jgi:hypothetical protein
VAGSAANVQTLFVNSRNSSFEIVLFLSGRHFLVNIPLEKIKMYSWISSFNFAPHSLQKCSVLVKNKILIVFFSYIIRGEA